jgi:hypothetical protein
MLSVLRAAYVFGSLVAIPDTLAIPLRKAGPNASKLSIVTDI